MDPWAADLTLAEIDAARLRNRRRVGELTTPLIALAVLLVCSATWVLFFGRHRLAMFYAPGLLGVATLSGWRARHDAATRGIQVKVSPWIVTAVVMLVLSASVSRWARTGGHPPVEEIGPSIVFASGVFGFGLWARVAPVAVAGACMLIVSLIAPSIASGDACVALQLVLYAVALAVAARHVAAGRRAR